MTLGADFSSVGNPNPGARVQLRALNELLSPSVCAVCGNGTHHLPYISPQIFIDWYGEVYFCQTCVREMGQAIGMLDPDQSKFLMEQANEALEQIKVLKNEFDTLAALRDVVRNAMVSNPSLDPSVLDEEASEVGPDEFNGSTATSGAAEDAEPTEPSTSAGPDDITRAASRHGGLIT